MPNCLLAVTKHFAIEWWPGADSRGLYLSQVSEADGDDSGDVGYFSGRVTKNYALLTERSVSQCFIDRELVPGLINELRGDNTTLTLLSRVTHPFVPVFHRRFKKDGGVPGQAYYAPLVVSGEDRHELADALETACSQENVTRLEANNSDESYYVLDNDYLENGEWHSARWFAEQFEGGKRETPAAIELPATELAQAPKDRFWAPRGGPEGRASAFLKVAKTKHRCSQKPCIDYCWIKPGQEYVEERRGSPAHRYHLKCAFRTGKIPANWLNPHFEQFYALVKLGLEGWIEKEKQKKGNYEEEEFSIPSDTQRVTEFVQKLNDGYPLDEHERQEWRDHLRDTPIDIEPFQTARKLVGLLNPKK